MTDIDNDTPLADESTAAEMTARAAGMRERAGHLLGQAEREREAVIEKVNTKRAEIARLAAEIEADERAGATLTGDLERQGRDLTARSGWLDTAADFRAQAAAADARSAELEAEREHLAGEVLAEVGSSLTRLLAEREDVTGKLAAAQGETDIDLAGKLGVRLAALDGTLATLEARQRDARDRVVAIGDGVAGLLAEALREAARLHGRTRRALNDVWPARDEAVRERDVAALRGAAGALRVQEAEEQRAAQQPRQIVHT